MADNTNYQQPKKNVNTTSTNVNKNASVKGSQFSKNNKTNTQQQGYNKDSRDSSTGSC